ncbi:hypothetical protein JSY14_09810 [Brachybacterium sp. EF45031]|uniref:hypothetical protein n=1 Tax=Brachybacterium sillae TaxID=2810536 RepID=UPI00217E5FA7|nr:hypothetical protein [Brachybacterium sillae]MCS6712298.1 hypothetical protein [Brachybacterium sillae]
MARSYATVGQMMSYAMDRVSAAPDVERTVPRRLRTEAMARHMLAFVLMSPRSREAFLTTIAGSPTPTSAFTAERRLRSTAPDLVAEVLGEGAEGPERPRVLIALRVDGAPSTARLEQWDQLLGPGPGGVLLSITRKADKPRGEEATGPGRLVASTWSRIGKRMPKADPAHAHLWETIAEFGESAAAPVVQLPLDPHALLRDASVAKELRAHLDVFLHASRTLFGVAPHFSTVRGRVPHLRAGASRGRTGLEFGDVVEGSASRFVAPGTAPVPLGIGALTGEEEQLAAEEHLAVLARRSVWRTSISAVPVPEAIIGTPATAPMDGARRLLWAVLNPELLADRGFTVAPSRMQPALTLTELGLRLRSTDDPQGPVYRITVGGTDRWKTLIPRVTREAHGTRGEETYAVAPQKGWSTSDFVWEVHRALYSLTIPPRG